MAINGNQNPTSSWFVLALLSITAIAVEFGCSDSTDKTKPLPEDVRDALIVMLEDVWPEVVQKQLDVAKDAAIALHSSAAEWSAQSNSENHQRAVQTAWFEAMTAWQVAEAMQLGAAGSSLKVVGGKDIRDEIYSWPLTNQCLVDQRTARLEFEAEGFFDDTLINSYGLDALETLLFSTPNEHSCPSQVLPASLWGDLGEDGVAQARADYAVVVSSHVVDDINRIETDWENSFNADISTAGQEGSSFDSELAGVNAVFDALFYLETQVKDKKLGWPLGLSDCGVDDCATKIETPIAGGSHLWIAANLRGFRSLYTGGESLGLYDLLVAVGEQSLADEVLTNLDDADQALADLTDPLDEALVSDPDALAEAHTAVKNITDLLKSDIAAVLTLQIPQEAAGDND
jgi:predicted lipoprotein